MLEHNTEIQLGPNGAFSASVTETRNFIGVSQGSLYELINEGELESYLEGNRRKVTWRSIYALVKRRLAAEAARRNRAA
jgi:hypothetical protein